eukprot:5529692-Prymnesium_polylepis.3
MFASWAVGAAGNRVRKTDRSYDCSGEVLGCGWGGTGTALLRAGGAGRGARPEREAVQIAFPRPNITTSSYTAYGEASAPSTVHVQASVRSLCTVACTALYLQVTCVNFDTQQS